MKSSKFVLERVVHPDYFNGKMVAYSQLGKKDFLFGWGMFDGQFNIDLFPQSIQNDILEDYSKIDESEDEPFFGFIRNLILKEEDYAQTLAHMFPGDVFYLPGVNSREKSINEFGLLMEYYCQQVIFEEEGENEGQFENDQEYGKMDEPVQERGIVRKNRNYDPSVLEGTLAEIGGLNVSFKKRKRPTINDVYMAVGQVTKEREKPYFEQKEILNILCPDEKYISETREVLTLMEKDGKLDNVGRGLYKLLS